MEESVAREAHQSRRVSDVTSRDALVDDDNDEQSLVVVPLSPARQHKRRWQLVPSSSLVLPRRNDDNSDYYPSDGSTEDENLAPNSPKRKRKVSIKINASQASTRHVTMEVSPALPAGSAAATTAEDRDDGKNQERRVANDAHYAAVQELKSFVQDFDFHSIQSLAPLKNQGKPSIVQLQEDDLCNAADFIKKLHRNFVVEELRTPDGMHMRREYLCSDPPEDSTANDITYSFTVDTPDAGATENDDDKEENDELPPLAPVQFSLLTLSR